MRKIIISTDLKAGTEFVICDYSANARGGEAVVEVHYDYYAIGKYDVMYYPESWTNAQIALSDQPDTWMSKVVYHGFVMPTYDDLFDQGRKLASAMEGTCKLYRYKGADYVVLADNSVITHEEDMAGDAIFPHHVTV